MRDDLRRIIRMDELDRLNAILETAHSAFVSIDEAGLIRHWNASACEIFGHPRERAVGAPLVELIIPPRHRQAHLRGLSRFLATGQGRVLGQRLELSACRADGCELPIEITISALREPSGGWTFHAFIQDISARKEMEAEREQMVLRLEAMARTDPLTGLLNRRAWDEELARELARARRAGYRCTVLLIDFDQFKQLNDSDGHAAGDELLRESAVAWTRVLRVTDLLARIGGDEFAVLLPGCPPEDSSIVIRRLRDACRRATISIGSAVWDGQETAEGLVRRADDALYAAKREVREDAQRARSS